MLIPLILALIATFLLAAAVGNTRAFFYETGDLDYTRIDFLRVAGGFLMYTLGGIIGANYKMLKALTYFAKLSILSRADLRKEINQSKESVAMKFTKTKEEEAK